MKNELNSAKICHIAKFMLIELLDVCTATAGLTPLVRRKAAMPLPMAFLSAVLYQWHCFLYTSSRKEAQHYRQQTEDSKAVY